jgi:D-amino peptidase
MMQGLDESFDAVFYVAYHGSISGESSTLSHSYNPAVVSHVELNGVRVGESGINALVALAHGVPVALVTGDRQTCEESEKFMPGAERVQVKESITRFSAANLHPEVARQRIREGAKRAIERLGERRRRQSRCPRAWTSRSRTPTWRDLHGRADRAHRNAIRGDRGRRSARDVPLFVAMSYLTRQVEGR